jgi:hypothetical protein
VSLERMRLLFRVLKSSFTDTLAYGAAVTAAVCWLIHLWSPAIWPGHLREAAHVWATIAAAMAAGMMIAKYVLIEECSRVVQQARAERDGVADVIRRLDATVLEARQERDRLFARESVLLAALKRIEQPEIEAELSALRKRIRKDADDRKAALVVLVRAVRSQIQELAHVDDMDIAHAATVLTKETQWLDDEVKKGEKSLYELVLATSEIQEHAYDLMAIRLQSVGAKGDGGRDPQLAGEVPWFSAEVDPSRIDSVYRFLKVAFHPDRFPSEALKEQAKIHFQQAGRAYSLVKDRLRTTH